MSGRVLAYLGDLSGRLLRLWLRPDLRAGIACLLGLTVAGPLLGLLWAGVAPHLDVAASISGSENAFTTQADIDAAFGFVCLGAGLVAGLLARLRAADGGWPVPAGLAVGGLAGALLAGWVGHLVRSPGVLDQLPPNAGSYVVDLVDMRVRATGLYLVLPGSALLVLALSLWLPVPRSSDRARRAGPAAEPPEPAGPNGARPPAPDAAGAGYGGWAAGGAAAPVGPVGPVGPAAGGPGAQGWHGRDDSEAAGPTAR